MNTFELRITRIDANVLLVTNNPIRTDSRDS